MINQIRKAYRSEPFQQMTLRTNNDRRFIISDRYLLAIAPSGRTVVVQAAGEAFDIINVDTIVQMEVHGRDDQAA